MPNRVTRTATPKGDGPAAPPQLTAMRCAGAVPEWLPLMASMKQTEVEVWCGGSRMVVFEIGFQHEDAVALFVVRGVDEGGDPSRHSWRSSSITSPTSGRRVGHRRRSGRVGAPTSLDSPPTGSVDVSGHRAFNRRGRAGSDDDLGLRFEARTPNEAGYCASVVPIRHDSREHRGHPRHLDCRPGPARAGDWIPMCPTPCSPPSSGRGPS